MAVNLDDLIAGGAGAVDEALFGLPEFALKNLGARKQVEDYIKQHEKAYRTGELVGTFGSMFIPVPGVGLVKGLAGGAKAAKAAKAIDTGIDVARGVDKALDVAKAAKAVDTGFDVAKAAKAVDTAGDVGRVVKRLDFAKLAKQGALSGGLESGIRGITSEKSPGQILKDIQTGALFGAGGGVVGGAVSEYLMPGLLKKLSKATGKQVLTGRGELNTKDLRSAFMKSMPAGAGPAYKAQHVDDYVRGIVDRAKKIPYGEGVVESLSAESSKLYGKLDDAWQAAYQGIPAKKIFSEIITPQDMTSLAEQYGEDTAQEALDFVLKNSGGKKGLAGIKKHLNSLIDTARTSSKISENVELSQAVQDVAGALRGKMDDIAIDALAKQSGETIDIAQLKKDYATLKPFENATVREGTTLSKPGMGSPTTEKTAIFQMLQGAAPSAASGTVAGTIAGLATPGDEDATTRMRNIALASVLGAGVMKGSSALTSRMVGGLDTLAVKAAEKAAQAAPEALSKAGAVVGGQAASIIAKKAIAEAAPETAEQVEAATTAAQAETNEPVYLSRIMAKMEAYATANGVSPKSDEFRKFAGEVYAATGGFQPERIGAILYPDAESQKAYLKALEVSRGLRDTIPGAMAKKGGFMSGETDEARIAREAATDKLASVVGDVAKSAGSEAAAKKSLTKILASNDTPERKAQLVKTLLAAYGVDVEDVESLGVV